MRRTVAATAVVIALAACLAAWAAPALAFRPLLSEAFLRVSHCKHCAPSSEGDVPPPEGQLEDPCGLAIAPSGSIYVADYYHRAVDVFSGSGDYGSQIALPGGPISGLGRNELDGVCGLAIDSSGDLYANEWHEGVVRLAPGEFRLDTGESTGIAVDAAGDVFVDDRTYVAEYAAPVEAGDAPVAKFGEGAPMDGYGLAVSPSGERVYVADAGSGSVEVFESSGNPAVPAATIAPPAGFSSLLDSALAIDPTDGHLLVLDDLQPGYEHPEAAVDEFEPDGTFLGQIKGPAGAPIVDGEPSGLAVDAAGDLFVTDGNGELGNAFEFGPDPPGEAPAGPLTGTALPQDPGAAPGTAAAVIPPASAVVAPRPLRRRKRRVATASEVVQRGGIRVSVAAAIAPRRLPRYGAAPIHFSLDTKIASVDGSVPPQLRRISVEINRNGHLEPNGLPVCSLKAIQPSTTAGALAACRRSLVGEGHFTANVLIAQQAPFPSDGRVVAFNGRWHGRPAILAHVYGEAPVPTSYTLPFVIGSVRGGAYGTKLSASLPDFTSKWGYVTGISLDLGRDFRSHGSGRSYLTAGCPAPDGFPGATFQLSRATLGFAGRKPITQTLTRSCEAR
jgi:DNA-binding beta-propeller fold protein YncE